MERVAHRTCPLCEATCGLELGVHEDTVVSIRGDADDVFSHGFLCPKGASLKALQEDPDRLRTPLVRDAGGQLVPCSWPQALRAIAERLPALRAGSRDAVGVYFGNPTAHSLGTMVYQRALVKALGTRSVFTASTVDQMPKHVSAGRMFGAATSIPVPDLDRTDYLLVLGANPLVSNGSLLTAPDARGRLRALRERGGTVVVVDPRRTRTAEAADRWLAIRPGADALLLLAIACVLVEEDRVALGRLAGHVAGLDDIAALARRFPPERVGTACGIEPAEIRRVAGELADAPRAAVYGRIGTCTQAFGTLASWLVDVVNALTGNLDAVGGAMFPRPAARPAGSGRPQAFGRWHSRVRGMPETLGELPVACLAEEIETPGEGQLRALVTVAGNPVLSTPDGERLAAALERLELMVCVDLYLNETTRHADVVLPAPSPLERSHYDLALYGFAVRNVANYSPPVLPLPPGLPDEWETLLAITGVAAGLGPDADVGALDDLVAGEYARRETGAAGSGVAGRDPDELLAALAADGRRGPERVLDLLLRAGPYGDGFGARPGGLSLAALEAAPHGIDLGPLEPRLPALLRTPSGKVELAPEAFLADVGRLEAWLEAQSRPANGGDLVLVGRRQLRSNNSWMHNLELLRGGPHRCTVQVHPDDAARLGLTDGEPAELRSQVGRIELPVEVTEAIRPGVVSVPHGWGHAEAGEHMRVAARDPGVNVNRLTDAGALDPLSGNAVLSGVPVQLSAAAVAAGAGR